MFGYFMNSKYKNPGLLYFEFSIFLSFSTTHFNFSLKTDKIVIYFSLFLSCVANLFVAYDALLYLFTFFRNGLMNIWFGILKISTIKPDSFFLQKTSGHQISFSSTAPMLLTVHSVTII